MWGFARFMLAVASLAAFGLCLSFWVLSYTRTGGGWHATYGDGDLCLFYLDPDAANPYATEAFERAPERSGWWVWQNLLADGTVDADHREAGFRMRTGTINRNDFHGNVPAIPAGFRLVQVPFWSLTVATALLPLFAFVRGRRRRRRAARFACAECGADLTDSPGQCPECGTVPPIVQLGP